MKFQNPYEEEQKYLLSGGSSSISSSDPQQVWTYELKSNLYVTFQGSHGHGDVPSSQGIIELAEYVLEQYSLPKPIEGELAGHGRDDKSSTNSEKTTSDLPLLKYSSH